jgi:hypothetical protein
MEQVYRGRKQARKGTVYGSKLWNGAGWGREAGCGMEQARLG